MDQSLIDQFAARFAGLTRAKGRYVLASDPSQVVVGEKAKGKATTLSELVTTEDYAKHLCGEVGLGIVPVRDDGSCVFGAIDIDQYVGIDHAGLATRALALALPVVVCRSKSGGAHVYAFAAEPGLPATQMIEYLKSVRTLMGIEYRKAREIFPKQKAQSGGIGNWINLPYFGDTPRKAIRADGTEISLEEFLSDTRRIDATALTKVKGKDDLIVPAELPPCLERLVAEGIPPGMRNEAVYEFAVFATKKYKMDRPKVVAMVTALNVRACHPPLSQMELMTSIDSVLRHEYNYKCTQSPIVEVCHKELCATRAYGPSASVRPGGMPEIERIEIRGAESEETQYYVKLSISPRLVTCTSKQLMNYDTFKLCVLDSAHMMLPVVKQKEWDEYITARFMALSATMRVAPERTKRGLVATTIDDWIRQSASKDATLFAVGRPFLDPPNIYISFGELGARLRHVQTGMQLSQVAKFLEDAGWEKTMKTIGGRTHDNVWTRTLEHGTELPNETTDVMKEVDGHIVVEAPKGLDSTLVDELTWDQFDPHEEGAP